MSTTILTHSDCDGICAGALALAKNRRAKIFFTKPVSFLRDLKETKSDNIIVCDIALTKKDAVQIMKEFRKKKGKITYFDHHPIPSNVNKKDIEKNIEYVYNTKQSSSELVFRHYQNELPRERIWIAIYGAIADYTEDTPLIQERLRNWDKNALYFEVSTLVMGIKRDFNNYDKKRKIVNMLSVGKNPSDVNGLVMSAKKAVNDEFDLYEILKERAESFGNIGYVKDLHGFGFRGASALFSATITNKPLGMCIHTRDYHLDITMRRRDEKIKIGKVAEKAAEKVGGSGGGHDAAGGARIPVGSLDRFLNEVNKLIKL